MPIATLKDHLKFINEKGRFEVDCNHSFFPDYELEILEKYGHWLQALEAGTLEPITALQEEFVQVAKNQKDPISSYEKAWRRYKARKKAEQSNGSAFQTHFAPYEDTFHSRVGVKKLRSTMNKVINQAHRK